MDVSRRVDTKFYACLCSWKSLWVLLDGAPQIPVTVEDRKQACRFICRDKELVLHMNFAAYLFKTDKTRAASMSQAAVFGISNRFINGVQKAQNSNKQFYRLYSSDLPDHRLIQMPALSPTMEHGTIVKWHKAEGDEVEEGDLICEIETDKSVMAFEASEEGVLAKILAPDGTKGIKIGEPICVFVDNKDDCGAFANFKLDGRLPYFSFLLNRLSDLRYTSLIQLPAKKVSGNVSFIWGGCGTAPDDFKICEKPQEFTLLHVGNGRRRAGSDEIQWRSALNFPRFMAINSNNFLQAIETVKEFNMHCYQQSFMALLDDLLVMIFE
uniref:Lipoyl-binding domain-containing protein n=1 Tax=Setaria digitata TaxID=48799 RepID=A0A915PFJ3_9BILA